MLNWPVNADGTVDIPTEQTMALRESFDLFDTDGSGALDMAELKTAMKTVGLEIPDKELQKMADVGAPDIQSERRGSRPVSCVWKDGFSEVKWSAWCASLDAARC
eukprot:393511-Rhodomonas_salina.2